MQHKKLPLSGMRTLDLTLISVGSVCRMMLGEHSVEVLHEFGFSRSESESLTQCGAVAGTALIKTRGG